MQITQLRISDFQSFGPMLTTIARHRGDAGIRASPPLEVTLRGDHAVTEQLRRPARGCTPPFEPSRGRPRFESVGGAGCCQEVGLAP